MTQQGTDNVRLVELDEAKPQRRRVDCLLPGKTS
jgi:hypothetical protein